MSKGLSEEQKQRLLGAFEEQYKRKALLIEKPDDLTNCFARLSARHKFRELEDSGALDVVISICQEEIEKEAKEQREAKGLTIRQTMDIYIPFFHRLGQLKTNNNE